MLHFWPTFFCLKMFFPFFWNRIRMIYSLFCQTLPEMLLYSRPRAERLLVIDESLKVLSSWHSRNIFLNSDWSPPSIRVLWLVIILLCFEDARSAWPSWPSYKLRWSRSVLLWTEPRWNRNWKKLSQSVQVFPVIFLSLVIIVMLSNLSNIMSETMTKIHDAEDENVDGEKGGFKMTKSY